MAALQRLMTRPWAIMAAALVVVWLAFGLRVHWLGAQSLWNDEGSSAVMALRPLAAIAEHAGRDIHPPGYYWLLALWSAVAGTSEFSLRLLSTLASVLTVAVTFTLGRRLIGRFAAVPAALFVALNSFSIYYAQEARMYALLALWVALGWWALMLLLRRSTRWRTATLAVAIAAGLYTHYAFPLFMVAQGVIAVLWLASRHCDPARRRRALLALVAAHLGALVLFLPWLPTALGQLAGWQQTGAAADPLSASSIVIITNLTLGVAAAGAAMAIPLLLALFGLLWRAPLQPARVQALIAPAWVIVPAVLFVVFGLARPQNYKFLLPAQPGMALWMAAGLAALWSLTALVRARTPDRERRLRRIARLTAAAAFTWVALLMLTRLSMLYTDPSLQRADYRQIAQDIAAVAREGDVIVLDAPNQAEVFGYYHDHAIPVISLPPGLQPDDDATRAAVIDLIERYERAFVVYWGEGERDPRRVVETTLSEGSFEAGERWYGDVRLARYVMPVPLTALDVDTVTFGEHITLESAASSGTAFDAGDVLQLRLIWRSDAPLDRRYKVFVQLLDQDGLLQAQRDSEPGGGLSLTTGWQPGASMADNHALQLPDTLTAGDYSLIVGLYPLDAPDLRLPVSTGGDFFRLATITIR